jgi:glycosyltransferase involved in cell wall biosynthesis
MAKKIISIIIPIYNMEEYLDRCLISVLDHKWNKDLEVIAVNDGSKDHSLQIILKYQKKYPSIIRFINKENGNYGSTINAALPIAEGKYIKILDADDWFNTEEFDQYIKQLKNIESDLIISNYTENYSSGKNVKKCFPNKDYNWEILAFSSSLQNLHMQAITYRTELLRQINYKQTEGISYTDQEWMFYPMFFVDKITFINANVYQYYIGRKGQTINLSVSLKNRHNFLIIAKKMNSYYLSFDERKLSESQDRYLLNRIYIVCNALYKRYLVYLSRKDFEADEAVLIDFDRMIKENSKIIYTNTANIILHKYIPFHYVHYWRKYSKRTPFWLTEIFKMLNKNNK